MILDDIQTQHIGDDIIENYFWQSIIQSGFLIGVGISLFA